MMSEALHRVAAARPMLGQLARTQRSVSNKYVQEFLKGGAQVNERTPAGMLRKVEGLIGTLDERVEAQLKKLEVQLGLGGGTRAPNVPHSDDELRATVAHVARLLEVSRQSWGRRARAGRACSLDSSAPHAPRAHVTPRPLRHLSRDPFEASTCV